MRNHSLDETQADVLICAIRGRTISETAKALGLSEGSVKGIRDRLMNKFGSSNITETAFVALFEGEIPVQKLPEVRPVLFARNHMDCEPTPKATEKASTASKDESVELQVDYQARVTDLNNQAVQLTKEGKYREALDLISTAYKLDGSDPLILDNLRVISCNYCSALMTDIPTWDQITGNDKGTMQTVIDLLEPLKKEGLADGRICHYLSRAYLSLGQTDKAITQAEESVDYQRDVPEFRFALLNCYTRKDKEDAESATYLLRAAGQVGKIYQIGLEKDDSATRELALLAFRNTVLGLAVRYHDIALLTQAMIASLDCPQFAIPEFQLQVGDALSRFKEMVPEDVRLQKEKGIIQAFDAINFRSGNPYYHLCMATLCIEKFEGKWDFLSFTDKSLAPMKGNDSYISAAAKEIGQAYLTLNRKDEEIRGRVADSFGRLSRLPHQEDLLALVSSVGIDKIEFFAFLLAEVAEAEGVTHAEMLERIRSVGKELPSAKGWTITRGVRWLVRLVFRQPYYT